jgi:hypothetical protein
MGAAWLYVHSIMDQLCYKTAAHRQIIIGADVLLKRRAVKVERLFTEANSLRLDFVWPFGSDGAGTVVPR